MKTSIIMRNILFLFLFIQFTSCSKAQHKQHLAVCTEGEGCEFSELTISAKEVDKLLGKSDFWTTVTPDATLILENCDSKKEEKQTLEEIDISYGGSGNVSVSKKFDLEKYLKEKGCFSLDCPNTTKKISFYINASGEDSFSGNGFFYLNLKAGEAYMPNEVFQQLYGSEAGGMVIDQFLRNGKMETYMIAEGQKYRTSTPIGTNISAIGADALNEKRFKEEFEKTGNTRKHLHTNSVETEYIGKDDEGKTIHFWIVPIQNVCLPKGKFDAWGFFNLGYISVDGITYLVTEISGNGFQMKLTGISDGSYSFSPAGYQSY